MTNGNEKFYDRTIAPRLAELANLCEERSMSMLTTVEINPRLFGSTIQFSGNQSLAMIMIDAARQASGNVDALIMALMRHGHKHGHSSICLKMLGVPEAPVWETLQ